MFNAKSHLFGAVNRFDSDSANCIDGGVGQMFASLYMWSEKSLEQVKIPI